MTEYELKLIRNISLAMIIGILAALLGFSLRLSDPAEQPTPTVTVTQTPAPELITPGPAVGPSKKTTYVTRAASCRNPGNAAGYCWFEGWAFTRKTICIDSSIPGAPLDAIARAFTGPGGLRVYVGGKAGACAARGVPASQRVSFLSMSKNGAARYGYQVCGLTQAANYGNLTAINVTVYVTGTQRTPCGGAPEWQDVFEHEFGHTLGLSHEQQYVTSIMRDGHAPDATDRAHLTQIYGGRRA